MAIGTARIVELRRYALRPGARETLIELFDREFVETQEEVGMHVLGQFRDLDDPDAFVWLRGFSDMPTRKRALEAFYGGPAWKQHAGAANATMIDVDNVLLLRPLSGLALETNGRPAPGSTASRPGLFVVTIYPLTERTACDFPVFFARELKPALHEAGISVLATYATEHSRNTYPALPVREDAEVFVWMTTFRDEADHTRRMAELEQSRVWRGRTSHTLAQHLDGEAEVLRLRPTSHSLIRFDAALRETGCTIGSSLRTGSSAGRPGRADNCGTKFSRPAPCCRVGVPWSRSITGAVILTVSRSSCPVTGRPARPSRTIRW